MSVELPRLEQLLADAAERHYGPRRARLHLPLVRVVIGLAAAAAAVALAIAVLPLRTDERAATPPAVVPAPLTRAYHVFAGPQPRMSALERRVAAEYGQRILDPSRPVSTRLLRRFSDGGVVAVAGTATGRHEPAVCLFEDRARESGGGCMDVDTLLGERKPWVEFRSFDNVGNTANVLVPDDVTSVRLVIDGGSSRELRIVDNFAYGASKRLICRVTWTTRDGHTGHQRDVPDSFGPKPSCG